jgi:hypothetical protein
MPTIKTSGILEEIGVFYSIISFPDLEWRSTADGIMTGIGYGRSLLIKIDTTLLLVYILR